MHQTRRWMRRPSPNSSRSRRIQETVCDGLQFRVWSRTLKYFKRSSLPNMRIPASLLPAAFEIWEFGDGSWCNLPRSQRISIKFVISTLKLAVTNTLMLDSNLWSHISLDSVVMTWKGWFLDANCSEMCNVYKLLQHNFLGFLLLTQLSGPQNLLIGACALIRLNMVLNIWWYT